MPRIEVREQEDDDDLEHGPFTTISVPDCCLQIRTRVGIFSTAVPNRQDRARGQTGTLLGRAIVFLLASCCGYESEGMVDGQAKDDESGPVQAEKPSLVSGGLLRMISPVSDTFK